MSFNLPVPKCKDCNHHKHNSFLRGSHYCTYSETKEKLEIMDCKRILGRDMKTSPKWCPKRKEIV